MSSPPDDQTELAPERVADLAREGAQLIDVREPDEYAAGRIEGSLHIALDQLTSSVDLIERDRPLVFYCRSGSRSALATQAFRSAGYDARNLAGGLLAWVRRGLPLDPPDGSVA